MNKNQILEKWNPAREGINKRAVIFVKRSVKSFGQKPVVETQVLFLLSGKFSVIESFLGEDRKRQDSLEVSIPDWEGSPNCAYIHVEDILDIHFPTEDELRDIFAEAVDLVPEGYAPFFYQDSAPQDDFEEYLKKNPEKIQDISRKFFGK